MQNKKFFFLFTLLCIANSVAAQNDPVLIFLSDTQTPIWIEKLFLKEKNNENATKYILSSILREKNISAVIHAGDITSYGSFRNNWKLLRPFIDSLKARSIPFIAAKGNHDYYFLPSWGMKNFEEYVPNGKSDYSLHRFGNTVVVILNSNLEKLDDSIRVLQRQWYTSTLKSLDADSTVYSIITVAHHSPYTNSTIIDPSQSVQEEFVVQFLNNAKCSIFISGHAHTYEHFQKSGKQFFVIGGGGGLLHPVLTNEKAKFYDVFNRQESTRFFHYVVCSMQKDSLHFYVQKLRNDFSGFDTIDRVTVPLKR
jgi:Icc-related predicted phosphoesterase